MKINKRHLTYCSNIHPGERWDEVFMALKNNLPTIKKTLSPDGPFGIGLRLSDEAAEDIKGENLESFKHWLQEEDLYVFTMNGFPFGGFHGKVVKDKVYSPDWTTLSRLTYTTKLFDILATLLPKNMDGGISTSPISYKAWFENDQDRERASKAGAHHMARVAHHLVKIKEQTGKSMHLDIEPEPDCLIENTAEMVSFFNHQMLPEGIAYLSKQAGMSKAQAEDAIREHIQLCYDICHFAVAYEKPGEVIDTMKKEGIRIGKIQVSAALKAQFNGNENDQPVIDAFAAFDESTYLHQVKEKKIDGSIRSYPDLREGLEAFDGSAKEWRTHFHVPIFLEEYGVLQSTRSDIEEVASMLSKKGISNHLEVETYTWGVLPKDMQTDIQTSILRELQWFKGILKH